MMIKDESIVFSDDTPENKDEMKVYEVQYEYNDSTFAIDLLASSWEEAEAKLEAIKLSGKITARLISRTKIESINKVDFDLSGNGTIN
jgi:hypothetical protein